MKKLDVLLLGIILIVALSLRLYQIQNPLSDFHSWRQADTAAVGRNLSRDGFNLLKPASDDRSDIQNPNGYRLSEFPLYNATFGLLYRYLPIVSIEMYGRIISIIFSLGLIGILYYLSLKEHSRIAAVAAAGIYATFPFFVFFSRVVLPDTMGVTLMFVSMWLLYLYLQKKNGSLLLFVPSIAAYALAILIKPTTLFYSLSIGFLFVVTYKFDVFKKWQPYVFSIIGILPFIAWRIYILQYPEGVAPTSWLIRSVETPNGLLDIFFTPIFFKTMLIDRIGMIISGIYLTGFIIVGSISRHKSYFLHSIFVAAIIYICTFQGANVQFEYYQTIILPAIAVIMGMGVAHVLQNNKDNMNAYLAYPAVLGAVVIAWFFSYYQVKEYYKYDARLPQIAKLINTFTQPTDMIVTDTQGDTTLLFLADRKGAPSHFRDIPELQKMGYDYFVTSKPEVVKELKDKGFEILVENDQFTLIKISL